MSFSAKSRNQARILTYRKWSTESELVRYYCIRCLKIVMTVIALANLVTSMKQTKEIKAQADERVGAVGLELVTLVRLP